MSETVWLAIIASVAPTVAALAACYVSIRNSRKADTIIEKAVEIHTLTNSNLSKVTAALETANSKITGLERLVASMIKSTDETTRTAAATGAATEARAAEAAGKA